MQLVLGTNDFKKYASYVSFFCGSALCAALEEVSNLLDLINYINMYCLVNSILCTLEIRLKICNSFLSKEEAQLCIDNSLRQLELVKHDPELVKSFKQKFIAETKRLRSIRYSPY